MRDESKAPHIREAFEKIRAGQSVPLVVAWLASHVIKRTNSSLAFGLPILWSEDEP